MLAPEAIRSAFDLPPKRAIEFFAAKTNVPSWRAADIWQEAHRKAFTVAKVMRGDILQDIRDAVGEVFTEGYSEDIYMKRLMPKLKAKGWWGKQEVVGPNGKETVQLGSPWRLRNILRTNTVTSRSAGQWRAFEENKANRPYLQYLATLDSKTRPSHRALHGKVFRIDDPIWRYLFPPNDWGCRCRVRALNDADLKRMGLKVSLGGKHMKLEDSVNPSTGEVVQVAVYTDPKTGARMATGPGWSYNPGLRDHELDLGKLDIDLAERVKNGIKEGGLARRFPVNKLADLEKVLQEFDKENPGIFLHGMKTVKAESAPYIMATNGHGTIWLSSRKTNAGYSPTKTTVRAFQKIANDEALSFDEEYCIESLWHEIGHNRQKYLANLPRGGAANVLMETLNQWVARNTYHEFLETLGGQAIHQAKVLADGYGYKTWISNWQSLLDTLGIDKASSLGAFKALAFESRFTDLPGETATALALMSGKEKADILPALAAIRSPSDLYASVLEPLMKKPGKN